MAGGNSNGASGRHIAWLLMHQDDTGPHGSPWLSGDDGCGPGNTSGITRSFGRNDAKSKAETSMKTWKAETETLSKFRGSESPKKCRKLCCWVHCKVIISILRSAGSFYTNGFCIMNSCIKLVIGRHWYAQKLFLSSHRWSYPFCGWQMRILDSLISIPQSRKSMPRHSSSSACSEFQTCRNGWVIEISSPPAMIFVGRVGCHEVCEDRLQNSVRNPKRWIPKTDSIITYHLVISYRKFGHSLSKVDLPMAIYKGIQF